MKSQQQMAQKMYAYTEDQITQRMCIEHQMHMKSQQQMPKKYEETLQQQQQTRHIIMGERKWIKKQWRSV
jgi:Zn ribbon nucleic-acid-binding protein